MCSTDGWTAGFAAASSEIRAVWSVWRGQNNRGLHQKEDHKVPKRVLTPSLTLIPKSSTPNPKKTEALTMNPGVLWQQLSWPVQRATPRPGPSIRGRRQTHLCRDPRGAARVLWGQRLLLAQWYPSPFFGFKVPFFSNQHNKRVPLLKYEDWATKDSGECNVPSDLGPVRAVYMGHRHVCAVKPGGQLVCFGWNSAGQCDVPEGFAEVPADETVGQ